MCIFTLLGVYLRVESVDHMAHLCLTFWDMHFSQADAPWYTQTSNASGCQFFYILPRICHGLLKIIKANLINVKVYLIAALVASFLMY